MPDRPKDGGGTNMTFDQEPSAERSRLGVLLWRVAVLVVLILALLFALGYYLAGTTGDDGARTPSAAGASSPTVGAPTSVDATAVGPSSSLGNSGGPTTAPTTGSGAGAPAPSKTKPTSGATTTPAATRTRPRSTPHRTGTTPRNAPETGGGSAIGEADPRLLLGGSASLLASLVLGLFTVRRWRRA
jgi:hypothetical protein